MRSFRHDLRAHILPFLQAYADPIEDGPEPVGYWGDPFLLAEFLRAVVFYEGERRGLTRSRKEEHEAGSEMFLALCRYGSIFSQCTSDSLVEVALQVAGWANVEVGEPSWGARPRLYPDPEAAELRIERNGSSACTDGHFHMWRVIRAPGEVVLPDDLDMGWSSDHNWEEVDMPAFVSLDRAILSKRRSTIHPAPPDPEGATERVLARFEPSSTRMYGNRADPEAPFKRPGSLLTEGAGCDAVAVLVIDGERAALDEYIWNCYVD